MAKWCSLPWIANRCVKALQKKITTKNDNIFKPHVPEYLGREFI